MPSQIDSLPQFFSNWELLSGWTFTLLLLAAIYVIGTIRLRLRGGRNAVSNRRTVFVLSGFALLFVSLSGPFEALSGELQFAHMIQHLIIIFSAPLLLLGNPMSSYLWGLPGVLRDGFGDLMAPHSLVRKGLLVLTRPRVALPLFIFNLWLWHFPPMYDLALENTAVHFLEHFLMFFTSVLFWWPIIGPAPLRTPLSYPRRLAFLLLAVTPTAALGAFIALSGSPLYNSYVPAVGHFGLSSLEDQRIAGLIMWVPGNFLYLAALVTTFLRWAESEK